MADRSNVVTVLHGANENAYEQLIGQNVGRAREVTAEVMNVPADARALVNGQVVENDHALSAGDRLEFIQAAGRKGA